MKISLITSTYNSEMTVRQTFESVAAQTYPNVEYILIDGGSTDSTLEIAKEYGELFSKVQSEPDQGIYDALNKGIALATGDIVGFIHSDDHLADSKTLAHIAQCFSSTDIDAVYSDLDYVERTDVEKIRRKWRSGSYDVNRFYKGWMPPHPTFYLRRSRYEEYGGYRLDMRISADYELMLRMLLKHGLLAAYLPEVTVKMKVGGESNVSWSNRIKANKEDVRAWKVNGLEPRFYTRFMKPVSKLVQFLG